MTAQNRTDQTASQVCWYCRSGKRKCTKELPSCARCTKLLLRCEYDYSQTTPKSTSSSGKIISSPSSSSGGSTISSLQVASTFFHAVSGSSDTTSNYPEITAQILSIITTNGVNISSITQAYFETIDVWLPIISPAEFLQRLETTASPLDGELACLLLCMHLVTQSPGTGENNPDLQNSLYFQVKALHSAFTSAANHSLDIIQAGVLICLYEQGHGMIDAAQVTLAICTRSVIKLKIALGSATNVQAEYGRLWWGIMILGCHLNQTLSAEEMSLLPRSSSEGWMELPIDDEARSPSRPISARTASGISVAGQPTTRLGPFCRTAEAAHLLGRVLDLVAQSAYSGEVNQGLSQKLDASLLSLAMSLFRQAVNGWEECCGAIGLCLSCLLLLHGRTWELSEQDPTSQEQKIAAKMALKSSVRMVIDITHRFHMDLDFIDLPSLPLPATYCVYRATMYYISFAEDDFLTPSWNTDLNSLKSTLGHFSRRWSIGKQYLDLIDAAVSEKRQRMVQNSKSHHQQDHMEM